MLHVLLMLLALPVSANAALFKTAEVSQEQFQRSARASNQLTYTEWYLNQRNAETAEAHQQVQDYARELLETNGKISRRQIEDWNNLRASVALNLADLEILLLLAEKLDIPKEFCRYALLQPKLAAGIGAKVNCARHSEPFPKAVASKLNDRDLLVMDGIAYRADRLPSRIVGGNYQWRIVSNEFQDRAFTGSAVQFTRQNFVGNPWVEGTRSQYQLKHEDFNIQATSEIVFKDSKLAPAMPVPKTFASWADEHKTALVTVGLVLGGFAAYSLRNKDLIVSGP